MLILYHKDSQTLGFLLIFFTFISVDKAFVTHYNNGEWRLYMDTFLQYFIPIVLGLTIGWWLSTRKERQLSAKRVEPLDLETFKKNMRKGQLIDIRKQDDYEKNHIKGARNFRPSYLKSKRQTQVRKDQALFIVGKSDPLSKRVGKQLTRKGYTHVYYLKGGFNTFINE
jgi:rhodanese-related sulfurtransferase